MRHRRFVTRLLNQPQLITPAAGAAVMHALLPGARLDGYDGGSEPISRDPREYSVADRTAIIPVVGELVHRGGGMDALSGVCSYLDLQDMITDALTDPSVTGIVLDIDSPGGEAGGNMDFAEWLAAQRGAKPIVASINSQACSGAYSIASAADEVLIGQDGMAGSIGVVTYHTDLSRALANEGVVVTYIYAGERKIDGNPANPLSPEAEAAISGVVDSIYVRFCNVVAANRSLSVEAVRATQAGIFMGQAAVDAGLADRLGTPEEALMAVAARSAPAGARLAVNRPTGAPKMASPSTDPKPTEQQPATPQAPANPAPLSEPGALPADVDPSRQEPNPPASPTHGPADASAVARACQAAGHPEMIASLLDARASMATVQARISAATDIKAIAASVGLPGMAGPCIAIGMTVEAARTQLFAAKAGVDAGTRTDTVPPADRNSSATASAVIDTTAIHAAMNSRHLTARSRA